MPVERSTTSSGVTSPGRQQQGMQMHVRGEYSRDVGAGTASFADGEGAELGRHADAVGGSVVGGGGGGGGGGVVELGCGEGFGAEEGRGIGIYSCLTCIDKNV